MKISVFKISFMNSSSANLMGKVEPLVVLAWHRPGGLVSSKNHMKKFHSILMYAENSWGFTEIKQVNTRSIYVCQGINGDRNGFFEG